MDSSVIYMERWRGNTLYRITEKGARVILRKRTKHLPKDVIHMYNNEESHYGNFICKQHQ